MLGSMRMEQSFFGPWDEPRSQHTDLIEVRPVCLHQGRSQNLELGGRLRCWLCAGLRPSTLLLLSRLGVVWMSEFWVIWFCFHHSSSKICGTHRKFFVWIPSLIFGHPVLVIQSLKKLSDEEQKWKHNFLVFKTHHPWLSGSFVISCLGGAHSTSELSHLSDRWSFFPVTLPFPGAILSPRCSKSLSLSIYHIGRTKPIVAKMKTTPSIIATLLPLLQTQHLPQPQNPNKTPTPTITEPPKPKVGLKG